MGRQPAGPDEVERVLEDVREVHDLAEVEGAGAALD